MNKIVSGSSQETYHVTSEQAEDRESTSLLGTIGSFVHMLDKFESVQRNNSRRLGIPDTSHPNAIPDKPTDITLDRCANNDSFDLLIFRIDRALEDLRKTNARITELLKSTYVPE